MDSTVPDPYAFNPKPILSYLDLPSDYKPSPHDSPVSFLSIHLRQLPPNLLALFSAVLTPQQRTALPIIRNRRQKYASTGPRHLAFPEARKRWPMLWEGNGPPGQREKPGAAQAQEEKRWAECEFLGGVKGQVGKLGQLLGEYEEEREAERIREMRREKMAGNLAEQIIGEEEEEDEEEEDEDEDEETVLVEEQESPDQLAVNFERAVKERFIYGLLDNIDYDAVDWDDKWDEIDERDAEERWFDEEEEGDVPLQTGTMDTDDF